MSPVYWSKGGNFLAAPENKHLNIMNIRGNCLHLFIFNGLFSFKSCDKYLATFFCHLSGSHCHVEAQVSRVTALCWAQSFSLWVLEQPAAYKNRPTESLLVGRLDGSLCWLQVTMQEVELLVKSTELTHCQMKEGKEAAVLTVATLFLL